jgi:hypothetical protein
MTESRDEIRMKLLDNEGRCDCQHAHAHHPTIGWLCNLTRYKDTPPKTCREMCGSAECRKHAYRTVRTIRHTTDPIFPDEFVDQISDYVTRW